MLSKLFSQSKIIVLLGLFVVYVCLELSLNLLLIDMYAKPLEAVFGEYHLTAERLELFGRTLSGFGLALGIISFLPGHLFNLYGAEKSVTSRTEEDINATGKWLVRPLAFVLLWALIIPFLRIGIDAMVDGTSNEKKLGAVRAIVYKEAYLAESVSIEGFPEFDEIVSDPNRKDLVVALIPSLAYFSDGFNFLIESNLENMADVFLQNRQEEAFTKDALPRIREFDQKYKKEWASYKKANTEFIQASQRENNYAAIEQERTELLTLANERINQHWKVYSKQLLEANEYRNDYRENETIVGVYRDLRTKYRSSKCDQKCRDFYKAEFAKYLNNLTFEDGEVFGVYLTADDVNLTKLLKSKYQLGGMYSRGRRAYLHRLFGVPEDMEYEEFSQSQVATDLAIKLFKEHDVHVGNSWTSQDMGALHDAIALKYKGRADALWVNYQNASAFGGIPVKGLDRVDFARSPEVEALAGAILGPYFMESFTPSIAESRYKKMWLDAQDNISFIQMVTSTAATAAFSPGGSMFQLGKDAVKLAVIPPVSIAASLVAIFLLFIKLGIYLWSRSKIFFVVAMLLGVVTFGVPVGKSVMGENSYHGMMAAFAQEFSEVDTFDTAFTLGFGYVLDLENGIFQNYRDLEVVDAVAAVVYQKLPVDENGKPIESSNQISLRAYDNLAYSLLGFAPDLLGLGEVTEPFDANITLLKQDMNVGAYLGVRMENKKVAEVSMPNFMKGTDIGLIVEQRLFYRPDWQALALDYVSNLDDPSYWLRLAQGDIAKETMMQRLEHNMAAYLNDSPSTLALLNNLSKKEQSNLILLELENSDRYRCFVLGRVTAKMISESIETNQFSYQELENCKARI